MEGFFPPPFLGVEGWSGVKQISWMGVKKGVPSENNGAVTSLAMSNLLTASFNQVKGKVRKGPGKPYAKQ